MKEISILKEMLLKGYKMSTRQKYLVWKYICKLEKTTIHAKWISSGSGMFSYKCSNCGTHKQFTGCKDKYCTNCGARMNKK